MLFNSVVALLCALVCRQKKTTKYYLLKGQDVEGELTEATKSWHMEVIRHRSRTNADATILEIGNVARARKSPNG